MTDTHPRATDGHGEPAALPINDNLYAALALLRHAYDCAEDAHAAPWDFALEVGRLHEGCLTVTDLRWLVAKGFVEHGAETSVYGDAHRSFTRGGGFNLWTTTCVVLTGKGAAFARQVLQAARATAAAAEPPEVTPPAAPRTQIASPDGEAGPGAALRPHWDPGPRELSLGDRLVKQFHVPAGNQELILSAFQEEGWPKHIDDPLPGNQRTDPRTRLNDVVYRLNRAQVTPLIRFHTNGHGSGVHWSLCAPKLMRGRRSAGS
jgi:hypothetical protein